MGEQTEPTKTGPEKPLNNTQLLTEKAVELYAQASKIPLEKVKTLFQETRKSLTETGYPYAVIQKQFLRQDQLPAGKRVGKMTAETIFQAAENVYPHVWSDQLFGEFSRLVSSRTTIPFFTRLEEKGIGMDSPKGQYLASLVVLNGMRKEASKPIRNRIGRLSKPGVSIPTEAVPNQIEKDLKASMPFEFAANAMSKQVKKREAELFGDDTLTTQLWRTLMLSPLLLAQKEKLLDLVLSGQNDQAVELIQTYRESYPGQLIPDSATEELGLDK